MDKMVMLVSLLAGVSVGAAWYGAYRWRQSRWSLAERIQTGRLEPGDFEEVELSERFGKRVLKPLLRRALTRLGRLTPGGNVERLQHNLILAGNPGDLSVLDFLGAKLVSAVLVGAATFVVLMYFDVSGLPAFIATAQPAWVKLVGNAELAGTIKHISPNTQVLYRHHVDHQAPFLQHPDPYEAACTFLDRFWDAIEANPIDAIEGLNETIATGDTDGIMRAVAFEVALSHEVKRRSPSICACLLNTAVGNPAHGLETELLLPAAEAAALNQHYIGYHPYFPAHPTYTREWMSREGKHHHLRALLSWDPVFTAAGYHVRYLFTEAGACGAAARHDHRPGAYNFTAGWRDPAALKGDWPLYLELLLTFEDLVNQWNATHQHRAEAIMLFTVGQPYVGWQHFKLWQRELDELGRALSSSQPPSPGALHKVSP